MNDMDVDEKRMIRCVFIGGESLSVGGESLSMSTPESLNLLTSSA